MKECMEHARTLAAQCWCDEETKGKVMDVALAEAVARRIAVWMDFAVNTARNADLYLKLLNECSVEIERLRKENEALRAQIGDKK
jgi:hypothetical protein